MQSSTSHRQHLDSVPADANPARSQQSNASNPDRHTWLAEDTARQADAQVDRTAADLEANIDEAAEQTQAVIGAVSERLEGAIEDAPRQTASVVQSVSSASPRLSPSRCVSLLAGIDWFLC